MEVKSVDREKRLRRKDFLEEIERASNESYVTEWDSEGRIGVQKKRSNVERGSVSRSAGGIFELKVRKDLEGKGWVVDKWSNNVAPSDTNDQTGRADSPVIYGKIVPCRRVFKRFGAGKGVMTIGTGFPDFVGFEKRGDLFRVIGVEVKMNGTLSREEKMKCSWLLDRGIFSEILVASKVKVKNRVRIEYVDFLEVKRRMRDDKKISAEGAEGAEG